MTEQIIIFIDQLIEFLPRDKDRYPHSVKSHLNVHSTALKLRNGERGGSVVECQTPEREVGGSIPTAAVLCP